MFVAGFDVVIQRDDGVWGGRKRKRERNYSTQQTLNGCCCTEGGFMEQKQPDLGVVFSLIDCPGLGLLRVRRILSEYLQECWEDKNHRLRRHTTEAAWKTRTKRKAHTEGQMGTRGVETQEDVQHQEPDLQ